MNENFCPCGSSRRYNDCCSEFIEHNHLPETAPQLMRSRYTAYVLQQSRYLLDTWHQSTRPAELNPTELADTHWSQLYIVDTKQGLKQNSTGIVEFAAYFSTKTGHEQLHEISNFLKDDDQWFYVDGKILIDSKFKPGRNSPCICGSGKKYKQCCL